MKQTILFCTVLAVMASCSNNDNAEQQAQAAMQARQVDSMKNELARQHIIDSMNAVTVAQPVVTHVHNNTTTVSKESSNSTSNAGNAPAAKTAKQRKGIGPVAAGAIIGAGAGAVTGAMVDKKKGEGAIIGGVVGAAAGTGVGAIIKKEQKKKDAKDAE